MKKLSFLSTLIFISQMLVATVHIVDNTGIVEGVFTTVRQAYDVAEDGDTIYLQPSNTTYAVDFKGFSGTPRYSNRFH